MYIPTRARVEEAALLERQAFSVMEQGHLAFKAGKITAEALLMLADAWEAAEEELRFLEGEM